MIRIVSLLTLATLALTAGTATAQVANPLAPEPAAGLAVGFDHGGVIELGVRHPVVQLAATSAHARVQLPSVPGLGEGALELGLTRGVVGAHGWGATATLATTLRWVRGNLLDVTQGGVVAGGTAGYFRRRWLAAVELGWEHSLVTYVAPTPTYRMTVYDAPSGVHGGGGGTLRGGLVASISPTPRFDVLLRAGMLVSERLNPAPGLPFHAMLGGAFRF